MRTNNHSGNAPMLAVNRRLGFVPQVGKWEMCWERPKKTPTHSTGEGLGS